MSAKGASELVFEMRHLIAAQVSLIKEGILIRGAITVGDAVQSWRIVFGPAVVRAYDLESAKNGPPRIVVDIEAISKFLPTQETESVVSNLTEIEGSCTYIDYFGSAEAEFNVPEQEFPLFIEKHRDLIKEGLKKFEGQPRVLGKYEWLTKYHNRKIDEIQNMETGNLNHLKIISEQA